MRLVTYNLRFDSIPDKVTVQESLNLLNSTDPLQQPLYLDINHEQPWSVRRIRIAEHLLSEGIILAGEALPVSMHLFTYFGVLGLQEALIRQVHDLAQLFGKDWSWVCPKI